MFACKSESDCSPSLESPDNFDFLLRHSIEGFDEKLTLLNLDVYRIYSLVTHIQTSLLTAKPDAFRRLILRKIVLIRYIFENYGLDSEHAPKLLKCIAQGSSLWKQKMKSEALAKPNADLYEMFRFGFERFVQTWQLIKCHNVIIEKMMERMVKNQHLTKRALHFLRNKEFTRICSRIHQQVIQNLTLHPQETPLQINLILECLKLSLLQTHFQQDLQQLDFIFQQFITIVRLSFRFFKKFYNLSICSKIQQVKVVIGKGLDIFINNWRSHPGGLNFKKIQQWQKLAWIIKGQAQNHQQNLEVFQIPKIQKSFAIKLGFRIILNWQKIQRNLQKNIIPTTHSIFQESVMKFSLKDSKINPKPHSKNEFKSRVVRSNSMGTFKKEGPLNMIKIRLEMERFVDKELRKLDYLPKKMSSQNEGKKKRAGSGEKELLMEDYVEKFGGVKGVPHLNSIKLSQFGKGMLFGKTRPQLKIQ